MYHAFPRVLSALRATAALLVFLAGAHAQGVDVDLVGWIGGTFNDVHVQGGYAYCAVPAGLVVMDVSTPADPREVARVFLPGYARRVVVSGALAYVANETGGLRVVDVSDPQNPQLGALRVTPATEVFVSGGHAYVGAAWSPGLRVFDLSDPQNPQGVATVLTGYGTRGVFVTESYTWVADGLGGLTVHDITSPQMPEWVARALTMGFVQDVFVAHSTAYVANLDGGLLALRLTGGAVGFAISGQVVLLDYLGDPTTQPVTVELRQNGDVVRTDELSLDEQPRYTLANIVPEAYELAFKASHWLRQVIAVEVVSSDVQEVDVWLVNGDVDGDNEVSLFDFGALVAAFGSMPDDGAWNANADLDGDEEVSLFDFGILVRNFGAIGDE